MAEDERDRLNSAERRFRRVILAHYRQQPRIFPWRERQDFYGVLIGEVLLQRTRGEHAVRVYDEFLRRWPDPQKLGRARPSSIAAVIRRLGLSKRAVVLKRLGRALSDGRDIPPDPDELDRLPGIGPYAAHSVPVFAHGRNLPVVDWVIARVLRRYFGLRRDKRPNGDPELWELARRLASRGRARELWLGTLDFAAAVCRPRPLCEECPLSQDCTFFHSLAH